MSLRKWVGWRLAACCAACLATGAIPAGNLLLNAGFEGSEAGTLVMPEGWDCFTTHEKPVEVSVRVKRSGDQSLKIGALQEAHAHMGVLQTVAVKPTRRYQFTAYVVNNPADPLNGSFFGLLGIEWLDADGNEIDRHTSTAWDSSLSQVRWKKIRVTAQAPARASEANFVIHVHDGPAASSGSCFVDDVSVVKK